ncbi:uncharacterized protein LOC132746055 [Ruditapes philippinarum]|uniref:uncharacterized protein LOC132746055 n=1 Tax=Ruditapes philippinarum TaxID=129788 RepID=UPI00295B9D4E|nr:uncharacterized protein LOC132746055 [Ruditapes philippinarum]
MAEESKVDLHISLVIVGDDQSSVKDLFYSFVNEPIPNNPCSVEAGQYVARKNILLDDQRICLEIGLLISGGKWETLTKFKQSLLQGSIYGAVIVHDTSESMSFDTLEDSIRKLRTEVRSDIKITFVMISGKNASENIVNYELGKELADSFNVNFIKADSNTNDDVQQLMITIINNMMYDIPKLSGNMVMSTGCPDVNKEAESGRQRGLFNRLLNPVVGVGILKKLHIAIYCDIHRHIEINCDILRTV